MIVINGGNHSQFTDDKHWEGSAISDEVATLERNVQFEIVQSFSLAYLQRTFGQKELFSEWLEIPPLTNEINFYSD